MNELIVAGWLLLGSYSRVWCDDIRPVGEAWVQCARVADTSTVTWHHRSDIRAIEFDPIVRHQPAKVTL